MTRLLFDCETNGLKISEVTKVHCIAAVDVDSNQRYVWGPDEIGAALETLSTADVLIGHNVLRYDFPVLRKLFGFEAKRGLDTLVLARLIRSNLRDTDHGLVKQGVLPGKMFGKHSLEAWGYRLGRHKMAFDGPWGEWSQAMQDYCIQDVETNLWLWNDLNPDAYSQQAIELEHRVAMVCDAMEVEGWPFDLEKAGALHARLIAEQSQIEKELVEQFGSWEEPDGKPFVPKRDNKARGYKAGVPVQKTKTVTFNPSSRQHIWKCLKKLGWEPAEFTDGGQPKVDDRILSELADQRPEAASLVKYLMLDKRLGQLANGTNAWLQLVQPDGRIHASYNPMGTGTGRASHFNPNIAQVPACTDRKGRPQPFGPECRELFHAPEGWSMIGADMSGLELRCLAHYLAPLDGGAYGKVASEDDIHTYNQEAAGLDTRPQAKTFIYAWLYGAGNDKLGSIVGGDAVQGRKLKERFLHNIAGLAELKDKVGGLVTRFGDLPGLDKRRIFIRSEHSALNFLLQGAGAILCKQWISDAFAQLSAKYTHGWKGDFVFLGWIHDEVQVAARKGLEEEVGQVLTECARRAGDPFGFRVPLDSEFKVGRSWAETH